MLQHHFQRPQQRLLYKYHDLIQCMTQTYQSEGPVATVAINKPAKLGSILSAQLNKVKMH